VGNAEDASQAPAIGAVRLRIASIPHGSQGDSEFQSQAFERTAWGFAFYGSSGGSSQTEVVTTFVQLKVPPDHTVGPP